MRKLIVALAGPLAALAVLAGGCSGADPGPPRDPADASVPLRPEVAAAEVLHAWDSARSAAWADGSVRRLRALYAPDAPAGRSDAAMLRQWMGRGLRVEALTSQVLALDVLTWRAGRLRLRVTDRVVYGEVVGPRTRRLLPDDRATTYVAVLVRAGGSGPGDADRPWLMKSVREL